MMLGWRGNWGQEPNKNQFFHLPEPKSAVLS
uniref:Uncharacterized protein n=1 Tax=Arundo donax TaxID=35708 RepID=A0A0A9HVE3_ARUDO